MLALTGRGALFVSAALLVLGGGPSGCGSGDDAPTAGEGPAEGGAGGAAEDGSAGEGGAPADAGDASADGGGGAAGNDGPGDGDGAAGSDAADGSAGSGGAAGAPPAPIVSASPAISVLEAETSIAAGKNGFVAVAYIAATPGTLTTNGYVFSTDDGKTWGTPSKLDAPAGQFSSDPVLAVTSHDDFFLTWVSFLRDSLGNTTEMHVYAAKAPAGSVTFGAPVEVTAYAPGDEYDKPWITVMPDDTVVVTYARTSTDGLFAARSADGISWSNAPVADGDGLFRDLAYPCHGATGDRLYAVFYEAGSFVLQWSDDGGATWPASARSLAVMDPSETTPAFQDPTCVASGNDVWVAYGMTSDTGALPAMMEKVDRIVVAHSTDGGHTFSQRSDAHDPAAGPYYLLPQLARDEGGGLDLAYYAGSSEGDLAGSFRRARSTNGGVTWGVSDVVFAPVTFTATRSLTAWLGDYSGWFSAGHRLYASFVRNQPSYSHVAGFATDVP